MDASLSPMRFDDIVSYTEPKPGTLRPLFRGKKRLKDLLFDLLGNARAIVFDFDGDELIFLMCYICKFRYVVVRRGIPLNDFVVLSPFEGGLCCFTFHVCLLSHRIK